MSWAPEPTAAVLAFTVCISLLFLITRVGLSSPDRLHARSSLKLPAFISSPNTSTSLLCALSLFRSLSLSLSCPLLDRVRET